VGRIPIAAPDGRISGRDSPAVPVRRIMKELPTKLVANDKKVAHHHGKDILLDPRYLVDLRNCTDARDDLSPSDENILNFERELESLSALPSLEEMMEYFEDTDYANSSEEINTAYGRNSSATESCGTTDHCKGHMDKEWWYVQLPTGETGDLRRMIPTSPKCWETLLNVENNIPPIDPVIGGFSDDEMSLFWYHRSLLQRRTPTPYSNRELVHRRNYFRSCTNSAKVFSFK